MEQCECETNAMDLSHGVSWNAVKSLTYTHCKYTIAFVTFTLHLYIVEAPFFNLLYHYVGFHEPCQNRIQRKYNLSKPLFNQNIQARI